jgi:hypothetical protein
MTPYQVIDHLVSSDNFYGISQHKMCISLPGLRNDLILGMASDTIIKEGLYEKEFK